VNRGIRVGEMLRSGKEFRRHEVFPRLVISWGWDRVHPKFLEYSHGARHVPCRSNKDEGTITQLFLNIDGVLIRIC